MRTSARAGIAASAQSSAATENFKPAFDILRSAPWRPITRNN
jgi:hypothetical protein